MMNTVNHLHRALSRINGRGYKAYKDLEGTYDFGWFCLYVDHVQGDPFASPSKMRLRVPMNQADFPPDLFSNKVRKLALEDFVARQVKRAMAGIVKKGLGTGKMGLLAIDAGEQEVLERSA